MSIMNTDADRNMRASTVEDMVRRGNDFARQDDRNGHVDRNGNEFECKPAIDGNVQVQKEIETFDEITTKLEIGDYINSKKRIQKVSTGIGSRNNENDIPNIMKEQNNMNLSELCGGIDEKKFAEFRTEGRGDLEILAHVDDSMPLCQAVAPEINSQSDDHNNTYLNSAFNKYCSTTSEISNDSLNDEDITVLDNLEARRTAIVDELNNYFELLNALDNISACLEGVSMISLKERGVVLHKYTDINYDDYDDVNPYINLCCMH